MKKIIITAILIIIYAVFPRSGIEMVEIIDIAEASETATAAYEESEEMPDPCTLTVVECHGEVLDIEATVRATFHEDPDRAVAIARCESSMDPSSVGDRHLMTVNEETGEVVGDSIGLFQIRTGAADWNRAARNGMTADEFRAWMFDPVENIKYARTIYDQRGWGAWTCTKLLDTR